MALVCQLPVTTFPSHHKSHTDLYLLSSPVSFTRHFPPPWNLHNTGNLLAVKYVRELAEPGTVKWRTRVSFLPSSPKNKSREDVKQELLKAIAELDRGAEATSEEQERVDQIARELEAVNPITEPLKSDLLNGKWELLYTTSKSILQPQRPKIFRPFGKIYQAINADTLRAQNIETWPYFNQVTANLVPLNARRVAVKFDRFKIGGLIPIAAPGRARGELEITYLDEEISLQAALATVDKGKNLDVEEAVERIVEEPSAALHDRQDAAESITEGINNLCVSLSKETLEASKTGDCSGADIDKRIRALKKKIRLAEGQQLKGEQPNMKPEQIEKMAKIAGWHAELKLLEDKRTNQAS